MKNPDRLFRLGLILAGAFTALIIGFRFLRAPVAPAAPPAALAADASGPVTPPDQAGGSAARDTAAAPHSDAPAVDAPAAFPPPTATEREIFARFDAWTARYLAASPADREALLAEGRDLATQRRAILARLIRHDPYLALASAVPMVARQQLSAGIVALLEERVSTRGRLGVAGVVGAPEGSAAIRRTLELPGGEFYEAFVFGGREAQHTTPSITASGIAVDGALALDERPFRVLEAGEIPAATQPAVETCAVSGRSTAVTRTADNQLPAINADTPAVEVAGTIHYLCSGGHIQVFEEQLVAAEGAAGGGIKPTGSVSSSQNTGVRTILLIRAAFPESRRGAITEAAAYTLLRDTNDWLVNSSYGNIYLVPTVTPLIILPRSAAYYLSLSGGDFNLRTDAIATARSQGYDVDAYDLDVVSWSGGPGGYGGQAYIGARGVWLKSQTAGVLAHELGHNFGVVHANTWVTTESPIGNGSHSEYGNPFDTMGPANVGDRHFNAQFKSVMNWLPRGPFVHRVAASGTYRIHAFDQPVLDAANRYALQIAKDEREYWVEYRQLPHGGNAWLPNGVLINWSPWALSAGGTHLLDMVPGSPDGATDSALIVGRTFSDWESGIHFTPVSKNGTTPQSVDVVVNLGSFPGNSAPFLSSLLASATTVALGANVDFTANASDPNGDALSYAWDFGDKTFATTNSPTVSKNWSVAGDYAVRCVVSDMKGGTYSRTVFVRAGSPTTFRITGTVLAGIQPIANVRVHNGLTGTSYRGAYTDSDGTYTLVNIAAGNVTLAGSHEAFTFAPNGFAYPIVVAANVSGANFTATETPLVTLTATDASAIETTANSGQFTLTRTGSTASALTVRLVRPAGSAVFNTDYTLTPALTAVSSLYTVAIPAGAATLNLVLNPSNDATAEGPEVATLQLLFNPGYRIGGSAVASVVIDDDDTALPRVAMDTLQNVGREGGANPTIRLRRTGSTAASLNVSWSSSGTALAGTDYVALSNPFVIPAGASELVVPIALVDDATPETGKTLTLTLATNASYVRSSVAAELIATMDILDDDTPTVGVVATDAAAAEAGADPGVFQITRTGSTALPLTVNYSIGGTAMQNTDFLPMVGVLTIPAGQTSGTVSVIPVDDPVGEPTETVLLQIRGGSGYVTSNANASATVNITDNSDLPVVTVGTTLDSLTEGAAAGNGFTLTTRSSLAGSMTVNYTLSGTAIHGTDYALLSGSVSMSRNGTATVSITPIDDAVLEGYETLTLTLVPNAAYQLFLDTNATLTLVDNDQQTVNVSAADVVPSEAGTASSFHVSRVGGITGALTVNYTMSGTATNGADYNALSGSVTLADGQSGVSIPVTTINDALAEGTETITLTLAAGSYGIGLGSATLNLTDNDALPVSVGFSVSSGTASETVGTVNLNVNLSAPAPAGGVRVEYGIGGGSALPNLDYQFSGGALNFAAGETSKPLTLTILDDIYREPNQTVILKLQNANGASLGTGTYTHTITDDDTNTVTLSATTPTTGEFGAAPGAITLTRTGSTLSALSVKLTLGGTATNGTDYSAWSTTWVIPAGQASLTTQVGPLLDAVAEGAETVVASVFPDSGYVVGAPATATVTIFDRPFDLWRIAQFGAQANTAAIGIALADPDGDGLANALEYVTGSDPWSWTAAPVVAIEGTDLTLTYPRALAAPDVNLTLEASSAVDSGWATVAPTEEIVSDNGTIRVIKARIPLDPGAMQFVRLRANVP